MDNNTNISGEVASSPAITIVDDSNSNDNSIPANANDVNVVTNDVVTPEIKEEPKPIYGGSSPVIPKIEIDNNAHRPIYGGANPLENTQSIPTINNSTKAPEPAPTINNDVKVDISTVTPTPDVVSPNVGNTEVVTPEINNTVVNTPSVDTPVVTNEVVDNSIPTNNTVESVPKKEDEIESLF